MFDLSGKNAFITGGSSGIGRAVAAAFIAQGAQVVIADIADASATAAELGGTAVRCDVSDEASMAAALTAAKEALGELDIVVLNAGVGDVGPSLTEVEQGLIEKVTRVNYWGVVYGMKHAPTVMRDHGSIISTSSMAAFISLTGASIYSASKQAVVSLTETAAMELGPRGIRVNCVCPGYTDTAMGSGEEGRTICEAFTALGRPATVDDMTGVYVFLASEASRYMTGQAIKVDGGWASGVTGELLRRVTGLNAAPV
jgi:NAD(P)-dependent dehydrogenase (short-subunit alcohol dehydrogenase family)